MTVAGSDSGGGAGIQADLKTFAALGAYGTSVLTAVTSQNTVGVAEVYELPETLIRSQFDAIVSDIGTDVVKTGMLSSAGIIATVADKIEEHSLANLVVDPVMVATSGDRLLREDAIDRLRTRLLPLARVVTPNSAEAEVLLGIKLETLEDHRDAARRIVEMGASAAVVKGGRGEGPATDILFDGEEIREYTAERIHTTSTHGTGCTFASAIAVGLARGMAMQDAVAEAKEYVTAAIRRAFPMGRGHGPLNHLYRCWD